MRIRLQRERMNRYEWKKLKNQKKIAMFRKKIEKSYADSPTGCGGSFGEILCYEIHESDLTFKWLAEKWEIPVAFLGELIADHCKKLER